MISNCGTIVHATLYSIFKGKKFKKMNKKWAAVKIKKI